MLGLKPKPQPEARPKDLVNTRMVIFGNSGSGKSALGWAFFSAGVLAGARKRFVVVEPEAYFYEGFGICAGLQEAGFDAVELTEEVLAQNPDVLLSAQEWAKAIAQNPKLVITARAMRPRVREYLGGVIAEAILLVGDTLTLWDELPAFLPHSDRSHGGILQMMNAGRKEGVDMILISQFRTQSHPILTKVASESYASHNYVFAYQVQDENELRALRPVFGDRTPELRELPRLHFLVRLPNGAIERSSNPEVFESLFGYSPGPAPGTEAPQAGPYGDLFAPEPEPEPGATPGPSPEVTDPSKAPTPGATTGESLNLSPTTTGPSPRGQPQDPGTTMGPTPGELTRPPDPSPGPNVPTTGSDHGGIDPSQAQGPGPVPGPSPGPKPPSQAPGPAPEPKPETTPGPPKPGPVTGSSPGPDQAPGPKPPEPDEPVELKQDEAGRLYAEGPSGRVYIHRNRAGLYFPKKSPEGAVTELPPGARAVRRRGRLCILLP